MESEKENASALYCRSLELANLVDTGTATREQALASVITAHELITRIGLLASMLDAIVGMIVSKQSELRGKDFPTAKKIDDTFRSAFQAIPATYESYADEIEMVRRLNRSKAKNILAQENIDINDPEKVQEWINRQTASIAGPKTKPENN